MTAMHGKDTVVLAGNSLKGYDLTGFLRSVTSTRERAAADASTFGLEDETFVGGLGNGKLTAAGVWDFTAGTPPTGIDPILVQASGGLFTEDEDAVVVVTKESQAVGDRAQAVKGVVTSYESESPHDDIVALTLEVQGSGGLDLGKVLFPLASRDATAASINSTSVDDGVGATSVQATVFYVCTVLPAGSVTYKLQDSADDVTFADVAGATFTFTTISAGRLAVTVALRRYVRAVCVTPSPTNTALFGYARRLV